MSALANKNDSDSNKINDDHHHDDDDEESIVFEKTVRSFARYREFTENKRAQQLDNRVVSLVSSSKEIESLLPIHLRPSSAEFLSYRHRFSNCAKSTQTFLNRIAQNAAGGRFSPFDDSKNRQLVTFDSISRVGSVLKSVVREFSAAGAAEREAAFSPLVDACLRHVRQGATILVPGAGLGRLPLEILKLGNENDKRWCVQGNEFSYHMLFAGDFILNYCQNGGKTPEEFLRFDANDQRGEEFEIYPYLNVTTNLMRREDQFRSVKVPDIDPVSIFNAAEGGGGGISFAAGEFEEVYGKQTNSWGGIVTCFFLDTAPIAVTYIRTIYNILEPGAIWCNIGPLLFHWSGGGISYPGNSSFESDDKRYDISIDLSFDEIREIIKNVGFQILEEREGIRCDYTQDGASLQHNEFKAVFFVARKPD